MSIVNRDCYFINPYDPVILFFMFQGTAGERVDLLSCVGLSFFYMFIQFYVHLLIVHIWQWKLLKQSFAILQNNRHRSRCLISEIFPPRIIMIKDPFLPPPGEDQGLLVGGFFNDLGKGSNIPPAIMIIHPRGKPHMNITELFYFCIPAKVLLSSL